VQKALAKADKNTQIAKNTEYAVFYLFFIGKQHFWGEWGGEWESVYILQKK
jgi:hypothetical protein